MPALKRFWTDYPGVYYIEATSVRSKKPERIYYIKYHRKGKVIEEKAGRQFADDMTPARAANLRTRKIEGDVPSNKERREEKKKKIWTIKALWEEYKATRLDLKGLKTDQNRFDLHLETSLGNKEPAQIAPMDVDRLRINASKGHKPATVRNILELLKRIVNFGVEKRLAQSPGFTIKVPKVNNLKTEDLTPDQLKALLDAIEKDDHPQAGPLLKMALFTGMRRGELFRLKWEDIDFKRGFISIRDPKGRQDQKIPLNDAARRVLQSLPRGESPYVFPGRKGGQRTDINKAVKKIKKAVGLPKDFRAIHGLRHAYASMLASSGKVDLYTIQRLLTHKSPVMTQRYAHLRDETLRKAADLAVDLVTQTIKEKTEKGAIEKVLLPK
jgi:integrase